ncbi:LamG-like jellyroll fold domain-containing protein [Jonesia quinghaiensis]|uniref:LamG-like jellyroll fold domain-containing protein n=1 Tax=Jonesia quinghaiensis TaxID=262806 RepID=UPI00042493E6|nr:LamG-like jellyroll fold domain-containing protein [Jonesia quinghaiensis]
MQRTRITAGIAASMAGILTATALAVGAALPAQAKKGPKAPSFTDVTVHDPSVVTSGDDIWVFGSHGASAHTTDLLNWTQHTVDLAQDRDNKLFDDIYTELKETFEWAESDTLWASDAIQLPNGKFALYYNACKGDAPRSALGLAIADKVDGPYKDQGILLKSGMWDEESENPGEIYDALIHPNAVDPDAFYDADGRLWMVYGSYSGGIFILEMDADTGLPLPDQGYGTHLIGGNHSRIEAPTIQYNKDTGYYYMYLSFGGLDATGGYNMRVVRSKNPDGPYVDARGNTMTDVKSDPSKPLFDDASIEPYGVKLMGSHVFTRELGDPGTGTGVGYVSPGHNTWYEDPDTGQMYLIFHSRFPDSGEMHQVRVQQFWFNNDGWPVVSPMRYAGEKLTAVKKKDIAGDWQIVDMGQDINTTAVESQTVTLDKKGHVTTTSVNGKKPTTQRIGSWKLTSKNTATLTLNGTTHTGVFTPMWDPQYEEWSLGLSVLSKDGRAVTGRQVDVLTGNAAVKAVAKAIDLGDTKNVTANLTLPTKGTGGTSIVWSSSNDAVVTSTGTITRPAVGEQPSTAKLYARVTNGKKTKKMTYTIVVQPRTAASLAAQWSFDDNLADTTGTHADATTTGAKIDITGGDATYVADGVSGKALTLDGNSGVRLPDGLIDSRSYSVSLWLRPEELTQFTSAFFGAASTESWVSLVPKGHDGAGGNTMVWSGSTQWYDASTGTTLPIGQWSHVTIVADGGSLEIYIDGERTFEGTGFPDIFTGKSGTFGLGVNWWDTPFHGDIDELTVWSSALSPEDILELTAAGQ